MYFSISSYIEGLFELSCKNLSINSLFSSFVKFKFLLSDIIFKINDDEFE